MAPLLPNAIILNESGPPGMNKADPGSDCCTPIDANVDKMLEDGMFSSLLSDATTSASDENAKEGPSFAMHNKCREQLPHVGFDLEKPVPFFTLFAWALFGASGWWSSNSISSQLPLFVGHLPSAECLGNQLSMATQTGNFILIAYSLLDQRYRFHVPTVIQAMMCLAICSLLSCAFVWDTLVDGQSWPLLALTGLAGGVGCMSNSTYWVLMMSRPALCTKAVGIGMSFGGVLTTSLAALQLNGRSADKPRFDVREFFFVAAVLQGAGWLVALAVDRRFRRCGPSTRDSEFLPDAQQQLLVRQVTDGLQPCPPGSFPLQLVSFWLHAITYAVPTLLPFVAAGYTVRGEEQQLLLWMLAMQQWGEWSGRLLAPRAMRNSTLAGLMISMCAIFVLLQAFSLNAARLPQLVAFDVAQVLLPGMLLVFFMSYGVLQTVIFLRARNVHEDVAVVEQVAAAMGFMGQMGAFTSTFIATVLVSFSAKAATQCGG